MALGWLVLIEGGLDGPGRQPEKCADAVSALRLTLKHGILGSRRLVVLKDHVQTRLRGSHIGDADGYHSYLSC